MESRPRMLLDVVRETIRLKHYSYRTEVSYINWIKRYLDFHDRRHPREMGGAEIEAFLSYLAVEQHVAASTQRIAVSVSTGIEAGIGSPGGCDSGEGVRSPLDA